ncbi:ribosome-associated heat shock protein Hsp15 [Conyzicola nivalis]|uniref:Ribosome-associated heat shock protein Hsp15 n=1 Tax=Conyzicola nivalis TaxID=1477021 RepID=A0ABV2QJ72_9MICO
MNAATPPGGPSTVRVDSWIWAVRVLKTRSAATAASKAGHVRVNDERAKAAQSVRIGDEVRVRTGEGERILIVRRLIVKRVSAAVAAECFDDLTPPPPPREERVVTAVRDRGAGRPTKKDRRDIERLLGERQL